MSTSLPRVKLIDEGHRTYPRTIAALVPMLLLATAVHGQAISGRAEFVGLGDLPGGKHWSFAWGISADGRVVVGSSEAVDGREAFRWTRSGGMSGLGYLPGGARFSEAVAASGDGSVIVGRSRSERNGPHSYDEAFRWTERTGQVGLGDLPGAWFLSTAEAVSRDGRVVAGVGSSARSAIYSSEAFRWTEGEGMSALGDLPGQGVSSAAAGLSADGSVIVGRGNTAYPGARPFRWTAIDGLKEIGGFAEGRFKAGAAAVSGDGKTIVGAGAQFAFHLDRGRGAHLGALPDEYSQSQALAISDDGTIVVGRSIKTRGWTAFTWDRAHGMRSLEQVLADDYGLDLAGWSLSQARGLSADGSVIVGTGWNPQGHYEAWIAFVPRNNTHQSP